MYETLKIRYKKIQYESDLSLQDVRCVLYLYTYVLLALPVLF